MRSGELPTNRELQVDFTSAAHEVYVTAAQRYLESKIELHPVFDGKPLDHVYLDVSRGYDNTSDRLQQIKTERVRIIPLRLSTANDFRSEVYPGSGQYVGNELFQDASHEVIEYYKSVARNLGRTMLDEDMRFRQIPVNGVEATWKARLQHEGFAWHVRSFDQRPNRQHLVAANFFVQEAMKYVRSEDFDRVDAVRKADYERGYRGTDPAYDMKHIFNLCITPTLPLNGHESKPFLEQYAQQMLAGYEEASEKAEERARLRMGPTAIGIEREKAAIYKSAHDKAKKYL